MIFLDSSFLLALLNDNETNHKKAKELLDIMPNLFKQKKVINNIVLLEVLNKLKKSYYHDKRETIINYLLNMDKIYYVSDSDYIKALELFIKYKYSINYNDCLIINTMKDNNIKTILSFDTDFDRITEINNIYLK